MTEKQLALRSTLTHEHDFRLLGSQYMPSSGVVIETFKCECGALRTLALQTPESIEMLIRINGEKFETLA